MIKQQRKNDGIHMSRFDAIARLSTDNYIQFNLLIARKLSITAAVMLSELSTLYFHRKQHGKLVEINELKNCFIADSEYLITNTGATQEELDYALLILQENDVITIADDSEKTYFRINALVFEKLMNG